MYANYTCNKNDAEGTIFHTETLTYNNTAKEASGQLKIQHFADFTGDYWILDLSRNYTWALVGHPSRMSLQVLSRTPKMPDEKYAVLLNKSKTLGFPIDELTRIDQSCGKLSTNVTV